MHRLTAYATMSFIKPVYPSLLLVFVFKVDTFIFLIKYQRDWIDRLAFNEVQLPIGYSVAAQVFCFVLVDFL